MAQLRFPFSSLNLCVVGRVRSNTALRSLKDFVGATIRMLDRTCKFSPRSRIRSNRNAVVLAALKTYLNLLRKEVVAAEVALVGVCSRILAARMHR